MFTPNSVQRIASRRVDDACEAFHRYQLTWTPCRILIGIDDRNHFGLRNDGSGDRANWPVNRPQHLLLNLAVRGDWGGLQGVDETAFPARPEVDYVRAYQAQS